MKQSEARILWNCEDGKVSELVVAKFTEEESPDRLYDKYSMDIGNCNDQWKYFNFMTILLLFGFDYGFISREIAMKSLQEFEKVEEWRHQLQCCKQIFNDLANITAEGDDG